MRTFKHFPQDNNTVCPICNTNIDKPCILIAIDGTQQDNICEAAPTHKHCIIENLDKFNYNKRVGVIYIRVPV